jgi:UDP-N-acetylglucosamine--N-acetylmuramyl-(pentapeptide) pyrophosphoryl-undecaprenol N-acetylglucosamine transferase
MKDKDITIAISTGGTGGHIFPAKALADFLIKNGYKVYIAADKQYEKYIDNKDKIEYERIQVGQSLKSIFSIKNIVFGFFKSIYLLITKKPDIVISFGSYATFPFLCASVLMKRKILLHEQNSYLGKVNYIFGRFAQTIMTTYREMYGVKFADMNKIQFVGNPVREKIKKLNELQYSYPEKGEKFKILILAGSGGATFFSKEFIKVFENLPKDILEKLEIVQQCREIDIKEVENLYKKLELKYELKTFFKDVDKKIKDSHLIISRSGSSIFEFAIAGKPMLLIPSPNVKNDHQTKNAKQFVDMKAAIAISEKMFNANRFSEEFIKLINNKDKLKDLAKNARDMAVLNAEENILKLIEKTLLKNY